MKNNTHTLYLAQHYIRNSYICSADDYFEENPFEEYMYQSFYAGVYVNEKTGEWYMVPDGKMNISKVKKTGTEGYIMLGHAYWDKDFSAAMTGILNEDHEVGNYDQVIWEQILLENVRKLPPIQIKVYPEDTIFEFDSLEDLRKFDTNYVDHTHTKIMRNISKVLNCKESEILHFMAIKEGLTNTSFVENIRTPNYSSFDDSKRVLQVMHELHDRNLSVEWSFLPWEEVCKIEAILRSKKGSIADQEFELLKTNVGLTLYGL